MKRPLNLSYFLLVLLTLEIFVPRINLGIETLTLDDIFPMVVGALGLIWLIYTRKMPRTEMVFLLIAWSFIGFLSALQNFSDWSIFASSFAKGAIRPMNSLFILVFALKSTRLNFDRIYQVCKWVVMGGVFMGAFALIAYLLALATGRTIVGIEPWVGGSSISSLIPGRFVGFTNDSPNFVGAYFLMVMPLTLAVSLTTARHRGFYYLALALELFGLTVTFTRASLLLLFPVFGLMLIFLRRKRLLKMLILAGVITILIIGIAVPQYVTRLTDDRTSRLDEWSAGIKMMINYPMLGVGFNRFMDVVNTDPVSYPVRYNPHNAFIMMGAEGGIFMLIIGISIVVLYVLSLYRVFKNNPVPMQRTLLVGLLSGGIGFILQNFTNDLLYNPHLTTYFWLFFAMGLNLAYRHSTGDQSISLKPVLEGSAS